MLARVLSRFILRYMSTASVGTSPGEAWIAAAISCSNMMKKEDERLEREEGEGEGER